MSCDNPIDTVYFIEEDSKLYKKNLGDHSLQGETLDQSPYIDHLHADIVEFSIIFDSKLRDIKYI